MPGKGCFLRKNFFRKRKCQLEVDKIRERISASVCEAVNTDGCIRGSGEDSRGRGYEHSKRSGYRKQWNVKHTTLLWDSVDCADVYDVTLNGKVADQEGTGKTDLTGRIRILENVTADESRIPQVQYSADGTTWNLVPLDGSSESGWSGTLERLQCCGQIKLQ